MNSYQKLKARIKQLEERNQRLLTDQKFYITEVMAHGIKTEMYKALWFGDSKNPTGKLKGSIFAHLIEKKGSKNKS